MKPTARYRNYSGRPILDWLEDSLHTLIATGFCLMMFTAVYHIGHWNGQAEGAEVTAEAFEKCGKPYCVREFLLSTGPAP